MRTSLFDSSPFEHNPLLRNHLHTLLSSTPRLTAFGITAVVTMNEINNRHGTGPLVKRILRGRSDICCIRSRDHWGGHDFGDRSVKISHGNRSRARAFATVLSVLGGSNITSVVCVPYLRDELQTSIILREVFDASLCAYVMDDQNVTTRGLPDDLMREFLENCSLRLATHPELRLAYERKYNLPFFLLPAVVPDELIARERIDFTFETWNRRFALLGSIWDQSWFDRLCSTLANSGWKADWFGNNKSPWLKFPAEGLRRAGIVPRGIIPEKELVDELRSYPFIVVPLGMLDRADSNPSVASLSLPGRILFAAATSHTPVLIVGSQETCGARFVRHFGIGECVPYDSNKMRDAMERLSDPANQRRLRQNAAAMGPRFSDLGVPQWLAESMRRGEPADSRFEDAFAGYAADLP